MLKLFRRKARIDRERQERALQNEQVLASQAALKKRVDKIVARPGRGGDPSGQAR